MTSHFIERGSRGRGEYDPDSEEHSSQYNGDNEKIASTHSALENGPVYSEIVPGEPPDDAYDDKPVLPIEGFVIILWDEKLRRLAQDLRFYGAQVNLIEE